MATRRNRIKGVLNIPARRKGGESTKEDDPIKQDAVQTTNEEKATSVPKENDPVPIAEPVPEVVTKTAVNTDNPRIIRSNLKLPKTVAEPYLPGITRLVPLNTDLAIKSDIEAPPSPTKINRGRIKAIPRLGQRRISFSIGSASESEDDSRRHTARNRNDSVCSMASIVDEKADEKPKDSATITPSSHKKEFNCVIQRKCRRTEQARKLATAKRDFLLKFRDGQRPDRQRLTMMDLIFYNPASNPMPGDRGGKEDASKAIADETVVDEDTDDPGGKEDEDELEKSDEADEIAPQVTINADGEIIIDEKSLLIENKYTLKGRQDMAKTNLVDGDNRVGYGIYKRVQRTKDWTKTETLRFYKALNTIGTDFSLMSKLFPSRTRRELKMKFKKEEKINQTLIDRAVLKPVQFDMSELEADLAKEILLEKELELRRKEILEAKSAIKLNRHQQRSDAEIRKVTKCAIEISKRKIPPIPTNKKIVNSVLDALEESDDENNTESESEDEDNTADVEDYVPPITKTQIVPKLGVKRPKRKNLKSMFKKSKISRIERDITEAGKVLTSNSEESLEPGSLMIVANKRKDSEELEYKVFMVTVDNQKVPIELSMDVIKNLAAKTEANGGLTSEDLFSTNKDGITQEEQSQPESVEINQTINEDLPDPLSTESTISEKESIDVDNNKMITVHDSSNNEDIIVTVPDTHKNNESDAIVDSIDMNMNSEVIIPHQTAIEESAENLLKSTQTISASEVNINLENLGHVELNTIANVNFINSLEGTGITNLDQGDILLLPLE